MLLRVKVCSRLPPEPTNLPVLTSTKVIASVRSMTSEPPEGSHTFRSRALGSCSSMRRSWKAAPAPPRPRLRVERRGQLLVDAQVVEAVARPGVAGQPAHQLRVDVRYVGLD